jgi:hypothetical protein
MPSSTVVSRGSPDQTTEQEGQFTLADFFILTGRDPKDSKKHMHWRRRVIRKRARMTRDSTLLPFFLAESSKADHSNR